MEDPEESKKEECAICLENIEDNEYVKGIGMGRYRIQECGHD